MKINEIAINEGIEKLGKYVFNTAKNAWELANDTKVFSKGGVKSADNLASPTSPGPAVWRRPGETGGGSSVPPAGGGRVPPRPAGPGVTIDQLRTPTNGVASMNLDSAKRAAQANAAKRASALKSAETPAPKPAADDLARQVSPADDLSKEIKPGGRADPPMTPGGQAYPEMIAEPLPSWLFPKGAKGSKTPSGRQEPSINRSAEPTTSSGSRQEPSMSGQSSGENKLSIDDVERLHKLYTTNPAAAQAAAKEAGIDLSNPGIFRRNPWKTAAAALSLPTVYNKLSPTDWPKAEYTPYSVLGDLGVKAGKNLWKQTDMPKVDFVDPTSNITPSADAPLPSEKQVDTAIKNDPANQEVTQEIEKWNREHPDNPIKENYTNELNRMVYLSRP